MELAEAMALLEIGSLESLTSEELQAVTRRAKKRWHPDNVSWRNDAAETARYTRAFQAIEQAVETVVTFLGGTYEAGRRAADAAQRAARASAEIIRERAAEMQRMLAGLWAEVKRRKYKWTTERAVVAEGRPLGEMLKEDFDDDLFTPAFLAWISGSIVVGLLALWVSLGWGNGQSLVLNAVGALAFIAYTLACWLGMMPLSRLWLPARWQPFMFHNVEFGLKIFRWVHRQVQGGVWWLQLIVAVPFVTALFYRNVFVRPLVFVARLGWGRRVIGRIERDVDYYAGLADWYVEQLLAKDPMKMTEEELAHLAHFHDEVRELPRE